MGCLPGHIAGYDSDDLLAYSSSKQSYIRDRYLGCAFYSLVTLALLWVIFGQILWRNEHFQLKDVKGIPRMWISHPTRKLCDANDEHCKSDFKPMSKLPYCSEYKGPDKPDFVTSCKFGDKHTMFPEGTLGPKMFIPTAFVEIDEVEDCNPDPTNEFSCDNEYRKKEGQFDTDTYWDVSNMKFYANVEDYRIQFTSTYRRAGIEGTSLEHPGFYYQCFDEDKRHGKKRDWKQRMQSTAKCSDERRVPLECLPGADCQKRGLVTIENVDKQVEKELGGAIDPQLEKEPIGLQLYDISGSGKGRRALRRQRKSFIASHTRNDTTSRSEGWDVWSTEYGDVFTLGKLLQIAGVDLDRDFSVEGESARMAGTVIEVQVIYSNLQQFLSSIGMSQVQYTYRVSERKLPYVSKEFLAHGQPNDYPHTRRYVIQHGILLDFEVVGEFGIFNIVHLLIMLTTALALLSTAKSIVDLWAIYVHPFQNNYFCLKYDVSPDFSDMWQCAKCSYLNVPTDKTCQGIPRYTSRIDTEPCGEAHTGVTSRMYDSPRNFSLT